mgnify:FL=1
MNMEHKQSGKESSLGNTSTEMPCESTSACSVQASASDMSEEARGKVEQARETAEQLKEETKTKSRQFLNAQKNQAAEAMGGIADALQRGARSLEEQKHNVAANYIDQASRTLFQLSENLRDRNADDLMKSLRSFAESQKGLLFGSAILAGFALSRFLKSSSRHEEAAIERPPSAGEEWTEPYQAGQSYTTPSEVYSAASTES